MGLWGWQHSPVLLPRVQLARGALPELGGQNPDDVEEEEEVHLPTEPQGGFGAQGDLGLPREPSGHGQAALGEVQAGTRQGWSEQEGPEPLDPSGLSLGAGVARTKLHKQTTALVSINLLFPKGNGRFTHRILTTTAARMGI